MLCCIAMAVLKFFLDTCPECVLLRRAWRVHRMVTYCIPRQERTPTPMGQQLHRHCRTVACAACELNMHNCKQLLADSLLPALHCRTKSMPTSCRSCVLVVTSSAC